VLLLEDETPKTKETVTPDVQRVQPETGRPEGLHYGRIRDANQK
jgi:hypothetical protein